MRHRQQKTIAAIAILMILLCGPAMAFKFGKISVNRGIKGSGEMETRKMDVAEFDRVDLRGAFDVEISFGKKQELKITIDDNLWDILVVEVHRGTLDLDWDESVRPDSDCLIEIVTPSLEAIDLHGAGDIDISDFRGSSFSFNLSGAGNLTMDGEVDDLDVRLSGAGDVNTRELRAKDVEISISGAGNAKVYASDSINGRVSGVGNLTYYGDPENKKTRVSGLGRIKQK
ncbi:MAG: DUF2807 domain-containing protein [Gemmatimonadales bacterium]|nr:DUF2807 domain-containing protein [Gemmatimonadales bacterium]